MPHPENLSNPDSAHHESSESARRESPGADRQVGPAETPDRRSPESAKESDFVTVARVGAIPPGQGETFTVGDRLVAVFNIDGEYRAIDDLCPHMGASLGAGHVEDGVVTCPWHAWRFRLSDGAWCDSPRVGVDTFEVRVEGDEIQVRL